MVQHVEYLDAGVGVEGDAAAVAQPLQGWRERKESCVSEEAKASSMAKRTFSSSCPPFLRLHTATDFPFIVAYPRLLSSAACCCASASAALAELDAAVAAAAAVGGAAAALET